MNPNGCSATESVFEGVDVAVGVFNSGEGAGDGVGMDRFGLCRCSHGRIRISSMQ